MFHSPFNFQKFLKIPIFQKPFAKFRKISRKNFKDLADYLLYLNRNKTAFNSYLKWKKFILFEKKAAEVGHFCEMCI